MCGRLFDMTIIKNELPSVEYLNECFLFDEENGILYWKHRPLYHFNYDTKIYSNWITNFAGNVAGSFINSKKDYRRVYIDGVNYREHRLIFKMFNGYDPEYIDHINGIPYDNRPSNLRSVPISENNKNLKISKKNSTGVVGVYKCGDGFTASCGSRENRIRKYFKVFEDAAEFSIKIHNEQGYHENHGKERTLLNDNMES